MDSKVQQVLALDGREYTALTNDIDALPNIKVQYEWSSNSFSTTPHLRAHADLLSDDVAGPDGTIEMSETQRRMRAHLHELVEELN